MSQQRDWFFPLRAQPKEHKIAALDCEGNGSKSGFVCAAVVSDKGAFTFTKRKDTIDYIFSPELRDYWIFAHNLEYDLSTLFSGDLRPFRVLFSGNNILWADLSDGSRHRWRLVDSLNILPHTTIHELGLMVGRAKLEPHPTLIEKLKLGTPFHHLTPEEQSYTLRYCQRDAEILYLALCEIQEELLSLGAELRPTVSGISLDLFRRGFMPKPWPVIDPAINRIARTAYYGARCEPYRLGRVSGVNGYDVSSLYPSVMRVMDFPYPGYLTFEENPVNLSFILQKEGITQCAVIIPDADPPILPGRIKHHLFFPTGDLTGAWPHNELRYALDGGAKIQRVDWSLWSNYTFSPFGEFIDTLYSRRVLHAASSKIKEHFYKLLLNSAYGRFGINSEGGLSELVAITSNDDWPRVKGAGLYWLANWPYALREIESEAPPSYANAMLAAYVTAEARIKMHTLIRRHLDNLIYTDTDSLWTTDEVPTYVGIGELRQVEKERDFWVVAPKEYAVFNGEHLLEAKAKGIPEQHRLLYLAAGYAAFDGAVGLREGLRSGLTPATWVSRYKEKRYSLPKRPPVGVGAVQAESYSTRPWEFQELCQAFELAEAHLPYFVERHSPIIAHLLARAESDQARFD